MENATKALLIAAGMLFAVMIVSLVVVGYNQISAYYKQEEELLATEQLDKFNKQFQNYYGRDDIRGNELISLMNKIIDYNARQSYKVGTNYERIKVTITIGDESIVRQFMYGDTSGTPIISNVITNTSGSGSNYDKDKKLVEITNIPATLIQKAADVGITLTDTQLQKLTMEISNILVDDTTVGNQQNENRRIRAISLRNILKLTVSKKSGSDVVLDDNYITTNVDGKEKIKTIKEIVNEYYQYTYFKRAYFKCTELKHNTETGRVNEMNFEVQTKEQNGNIVVQFD